MENEHQKNNIQKIIQLPAQEEALKHHQVRERSVWIQKALKYNQKNEKGQLQRISIGGLYLDSNLHIGECKLLTDLDKKSVFIGNIH